MPDYSQGKIYTIRSKTDDTLIYVGSTCQSLAMRIGGHRRASRKERHKNTLFYKTVAGDWSSFFIELHQDFPCERKEQLNKREGEIIREISTLNMKVEGRTQQEYYQDNIEVIAENQKKYVQDNKEAIAERKKKYRQENAEAIAEYKKKYQQDNKEAIAEKKKHYNKQYRAKKKAEKEQQQ